MRGADAIDHGLIDGQIQPQLLAPRSERLDRAHRRAERAVVAADLIVLLAHAVDRHQEVERNVARPAFAEVDDSIGQEAVGRDVQHCRRNRVHSDARDVGKIAAHERFAAGQTHGVHRRELGEYPLDLRQRQVAFAVFAPRVAHHAPRVAGKGDRVGEHARQTSVAAADVADRFRQRRGAPQGSHRFTT